MKTKPIFLAILAGFIWVLTSLNLCSCAPDVQRLSVISALQCTEQAAVTDICKDCGHTKSCCFQHQKAPAAVAAAIDLDDVQIRISQLPVPSLLQMTFSESGACIRNKAPPDYIAFETPAFRKQILLI